MIRIGAFDRHLEPLAWWEVELLPAGWYVDELLVEPAAGGVTGTVTSTLSDATLSSSGTVVTPSTSSAILITGSNNPSYRSGFYSPRRGGTPKYPSLWDGCVGAWAPSLGQTGLTLRDESVFGNHGTLTNMDAASDWVVSGGKGALDFDGSNDYVNIFGTSDPKAVLPTGSLTEMCWFRSTQTWNTNFWPGTAGLVTGATSGAGTGDYGIMGCRYNGQDGQVVFFVGVNGSVNDYFAGSGGTALNDGRWHHAVGVFNLNQSISLWIDGVLQQTTSVPNGGVLNTAPLQLGWNQFHGGNSAVLNGQLDDIRLYNRALSPSEIKLLATRRGIAFERASRKLTVFTAPAPTGSVSSTLANATLSATGTVAAGASGSVVRTLDAATLSSSGTIGSGLTGSVSASLGAATLSSSATLAAGASGSVSRTLDNATLSSSGTVAAGASGTVTRTLDAATLSSSGTVGSGLTGSVSVSLSAATLSSSGTLTAGATGSVSRTLANATLSSSGTLTAGASGTVSRTLDNATLSSTGGAAGTVTGSVSSTLAAVTCSSSGTLAAGLSGTVVRTLDAVTVSATGTVTNGASGTVTRTLANATLSSGGSLSAGLTAQVNRALESCVVSASGTLASGLTGTLSVQLASATLQSGNVAVGGLRIKVGGEWKNANAFVKVTGSWKNATPFVKVSGVWK